jgi:hypothetical protein
MKQTAAKALVRNFFYTEFLPEVLPQQLLRSGNYLVLLGQDEYELAHLDALQVPRFRVYSVERDEEIALEQALRSSRGELGVGLYAGELSSFIRHNLQSNQRFLVLNLDICGAYRTSIDPIMTSVLLFAWRNPRTVIATYSNAARDPSTLQDGLKSLLICMGTAPAATRDFVCNMFSRYRAAGLKQSVAFNMVLRQMFWVRSHLEHVLLAGVSAGHTKPEKAKQLLDELESNWAKLTGKIKLPLTFGKLLELAKEPTKASTKAKCFHLGLGVVQTTTYQAADGWYHQGWFAVYNPIEPASMKDWLEATYAALLSKPLAYADTDSRELGLYQSGGGEIPEETVIWKGSDFKPPKRQLPMPEPIPNFQALTSSVVSDPAAALTTVDLIPTIRELAEAGLNTDQIEARLPKVDPPVPRKTITAHVAVASGRRNKRK